MNKVNAIYVSILALIVAVIALVMCIICCNKKPAAVDRPMLSQEDITEILSSKPEIITNAMQNAERMRAEAERKQAEAALAANIEDINNYAASPVIGNPDGKVNVVEFFDFACHYCHDLAPKLLNVMKNDNNVRLVLKPVYFLSPTSDYAARVLYAAAEQGKAEAFYETVMSNKTQLTNEKVDELAVQAGVDMEKAKSVMRSAKVNQAMSDTAQLSQNIGIRGVPTLVIDGKMVQTLDENVIQQKVNEAK